MPDRDPFPPIVETVLRQIPAWRKIEAFQVEPLEGLTNRNFGVTADGKRYVLRLSGQNTARLGIRREHEFEILQAVSAAGIGAPVEYFQLPEGHLVTRYIEGHHLTLQEYRDPQNLERIVKTLKRLHALPPVQAVFSPFERVELFAQHARSMGVALPPDFDRMCQSMEAIRREQAMDPFPWKRLCHNDLFCVNVVDDGEIWFIDWEFAGMGDLYYDLATLTYAYDSLDTLPPDLQETLLACYFGEVRQEHWARLKGMQYMLLFFTALWGLLQQGMVNQGLVRPVEGFDYWEYAQVTFEGMRTFR